MVDQVYFIFILLDHENKKKISIYKTTGSYKYEIGVTITNCRNIVQ